LRSKPRGIRCARKLRLSRKKNKWADLKYKKRNLGTWLKANPFAGSSHAKGIVLEKMCVPAPFDPSLRRAPLSWVVWASTWRRRPGWLLRGWRAAGGPEAQRWAPLLRVAVARRGGGCAGDNIRSLMGVGVSATHGPGPAGRALQ
jgi:hypothetical protein